MTPEEEVLESDVLGRRDPALIARLLPPLRALNRSYLRLQCEGFDTVDDGPVLYVGNHNGGIAGPDLSCTLGTLWDLRGPEAPLFALAHDFAMKQVPVLGATLARFGALRARRENALHALRSGAQVLVYPGGDLEAYRLTRRRDEIVFGDRDGFVRVAQAARVPIVPIVAHGAHRSGYVFSEGKRLARVLRLERWARLERFPLALALPWGLALGPWTPYLPLPFPIRLRKLPPIVARPGDDPIMVQRKVRAVMQSALDELARSSRGAS